MSIHKKILACIAFGFIAFPAAAATTTLTVVKVDPDKIDCVFNPTCSVTPTDSMGNFPDDKGFTGPVRLQSRTFMGALKSKAAGKTAYIYRIDMTHAVRGKEMHCADSMDLDFGPVEKLPYGAKGEMGDVFVINAGPNTSVGIKKASQNKNTVSIEFESPICPANGGYPGLTSFFFGLASAKAPAAGTAKVSLTFGGGESKVPDRQPAH